MASISPGTEREGKESLIADYCRKQIESELDRCIWLCIASGRSHRLIDIPLASEKQTIGIHDIRKRYSWFKRHSLYSVVGVRECKAHILKVDKPTQNISVAVRPFDHEHEEADQKRRLESAFADAELAPNFQFDECGVSITGECRCEGPPCVNTISDRVTGENECIMKTIYTLSRSLESTRWLKSMLEYYWQNGIDEKGMDLLASAGFVTPYEDLIYDKGLDAAGPYGRPLNVFLVNDGWNISLLLKLIGIGVVLTILVIAIVTVACQSFDLGLTAGSYAIGLLATLLAAFTFLSAVL